MHGIASQDFLNQRPELSRQHLTHRQPADDRGTEKSGSRLALYDSRTLPSGIASRV